MRSIRKRLLLLVLTLCLCLAACGSGDTKPAANYRVIVATDIHYLAPELTDHGEYFWRIMQNGDGKVTEYCEEITDAFLAEVIAQQPEALILTGDLSFNGALQSHRALAERLAAVEAAGVPVLVLPGNHDVYRSVAASFHGDSYEPLPSATSEEFREIYAAFGFDEAIAEDGDSLSYVAQLNDATRVLMLDADTLHDFCGLSADTMSWIEEQLRLAQEQGQEVLAACHQNLFQHSMFRAGYVIDGTEELAALLEKYGVPLFLSGHMHIQHIQTEGAVTEIAASALIMGACQYGVLTAEDGHYRYRTQAVDVAGWARKEGCEDGNLLDFATYAKEAMLRRTRVQAAEQLAGRGYSPEEQEAMVRYACELNYAYFSGDLSHVAEIDPDGRLAALWADSGTFFGLYFDTFAGEIGNDHTHWEKD